MQAYSPALPVGYQRYYTSSLAAFKEIIKGEGWLGVMRGTYAACLRTAMGSSVSVHCFILLMRGVLMCGKVQVPSYVWTKTQLIQRGIMPADSFWTFLFSSSVSGFCVVRIITRSVPYDDTEY
jgi:solute carrier family 25 protein 34/35